MMLLSKITYLDDQQHQKPPSMCRQFLCAVYGNSHVLQLHKLVDTSWYIAIVISEEDSTAPQTQPDPEAVWNLISIQLLSGVISTRLAELHTL